MPSMGLTQSLLRGAQTLSPGANRYGMLRSLFGNLQRNPVMGQEPSAPSQGLWGTLAGAAGATAPGMAPGQPGTMAPGMTAGPDRKSVV